MEEERGSIRGIADRHWTIVDARQVHERGGMSLRAQRHVMEQHRTPAAAAAERFVRAVAGRFGAQRARIIGLQDRARGCMAFVVNGGRAVSFCRRRRRMAVRTAVRQRATRQRPDRAKAEQA